MHRRNVIPTRRALLCVLVLVLQVGWVALVGCGAPGPYKANLTFKVAESSKFELQSGADIKWSISLYMSKEGDWNVPYDANKWSSSETRVPERFNWTAKSSGFSIPAYTEVYLINGRLDPPEQPSAIIASTMIIRVTLSESWVKSALTPEGLKITLANTKAFNFNLDCAYINRIEGENQSQAMAAYKPDTSKAVSTSDANQVLAETIELGQNVPSPTGSKCP